jgi:class I fructose-bisphosphate aldolase
MGAGFTYRMTRLFGAPSGGRSMMVAMDHGTGVGNVQGPANPRALLSDLVAARGAVDGILLSPGMVAVTTDLFGMQGAPARILASDLPLQTNVPGELAAFETHIPTASLEDAVRLGVDCLKVLMIWGVSHPLQGQNIATIVRFRQACSQWDVPLMVETVLWGDAIPEAKRDDPNLIAHACRMAYELGADILKVPFLDDPAALRALVDQTPIPIVVLGGPKAPSARVVLERAARAMSAGARGIVFGRNVYQYADPVRISAALHRVVHDGIDAEAAMQDDGGAPWA